MTKLRLFKRTILLWVVLLLIIGSVPTGSNQISSFDHLFPIPRVSASQGGIVQASAPTTPFFAANSSGIYWGNMELSLPVLDIAGTSNQCTYAQSSSLTSNSTTFDYYFSGAFSGYCGSFGGSVSSSFNVYVDNKSSTDTIDKEVYVSGQVAISGTGNVSDSLIMPLKLPASFSVYSQSVNTTSASFSWADMSSFNPVYNSSANALSVGSSYCNGSCTLTFSYDPTLVQHNSNTASNSASLSVSYASRVTSGDLLVVGITFDSSTDTITSVTDNISSVWTKAVSQVSSTDAATSAIYYAIAASSNPDKVNIDFSASVASSGALLYEVSGPSLLEGTGTGICNSSCSTSMSTSSISYSSSYFLLAVGNDGFSTCCTVGTGFTLLNSGNTIITEYALSGVSSPSTFPMAHTGTSAWNEISAAFVQTITQPITLSLGSGGTSGTFALSGCSVSPTTIASDGTQHSFTASPSCSITLTVPADTKDSRYRFAGQTSTVSIPTCSSGTCSNFAVTAYFEENYTLAYSVGKSNPPGFSNLTSTSGGSNYKVSLTKSNSTYWVDYNQIWSINEQFFGNTHEQYNSTQTLSGTVTAAKNLTIVYSPYWNVTSSESSTFGSIQILNGELWYQNATVLQLEAHVASGQSFNLWSSTNSSKMSFNRPSNIVSNCTLYGYGIISFTVGEGGGSSGSSGNSGSQNTQIQGSTLVINSVTVDLAPNETKRINVTFSNIDTSVETTITFFQIAAPTGITIVAPKLPVTIPPFSRKVLTFQVSASPGLTTGVYPTVISVSYSEAIYTSTNSEIGLTSAFQIISSIGQQTITANTQLILEAMVLVVLILVLAGGIYAVKKHYED